MAFSERKIIFEITRGIKNPASVFLGAGRDDCALVRSNGRLLAITSDIMFQSSHFPKKLKPEEMGQKAVAANLSDLASMGAKPLYIVLSLGIPKKYPWLARFIRGITATSRKYGATIIGGDTKCSRELTVSICAVGEIRGKPLTRSNARPGDVVAVTGEIGSAFCALHSLVNNKKASKSLVNSFTCPHARVKEGLALSHALSRAAAMDITDGLLYTASEVARESKVKIEIDSKQIPISPLALDYSKRNKLSFNSLINTGEDYELLVCLSEKDFERVKGKAKLTRIGRVVKGKGGLLDGKTMGAKGYDAFAGKL